MYGQRQVLAALFPEKETVIHRRRIIRMYCEYMGSSKRECVIRHSNFRLPWVRYT